MNSLFWALLGCHRLDPVPPALLDTGWFTGTTPSECEHQVADRVPRDGEAGVYWRDKPVVYTTTDVAHAYDAWLETADGERLDTSIEWLGGLSFTLVWQGQLEPSTDYVLGVRDCVGVHSTTFRTSELGTPLALEPHELEGRTWLLDLLGATWVQPVGVAGILQLTFTTPVLLGVRFADDTYIDLIGAPGVSDELGAVSQDRTASTWDFPVTDFTGAPYFETRVAQIVLKYADTEIPVEDFLLQATLSADGTRLGGGVLQGLGDTRNVHELLPNGDEDTLCGLVAAEGVSCVPCADGQPYCLDLQLRDLEGSWLPELVLVELD